MTREVIDVGVPVTPASAAPEPEEPAVPAYALAHLRSLTFGEEVADYLRRVDATLPPYGGRFLVHGVVPEVLEGPFPGAVVVIAFPDLEQARAWYASPAYQGILPLRTRNSDSVAVLLDGVPEGYLASSFLQQV